MTEATICFHYDDGVPFSFMDKIANLVIQKFQCSKHIAEGDPTPADRIIYLFKKESAGLIENYHKRKLDFYRQNLILRILGWRSFKKQEKVIIDTALCEIYTDHDFPFIRVYSKIHNDKELEEIIIVPSGLSGAGDFYVA